MKDELREKGLEAFRAGRYQEAKDSFRELVRRKYEERNGLRATIAQLVNVPIAEIESNGTAACDEASSNRELGASKEKMQHEQQEQHQKQEQEHREHRFSCENYDFFNSQINGDSLIEWKMEEDKEDEDTEKQVTTPLTLLVSGVGAGFKPNSVQHEEAKDFEGERWRSSHPSMHHYFCGNGNNNNDND